MFMRKTKRCTLACFIVVRIIIIDIDFKCLRKDSLQFVMGRLNIILNFILLGLFVYRSLNISGETDVSEKGIGMLLPVLSIVFVGFGQQSHKKG